MSIKFLTLPNKEEERAQKLTQDNSETLWVVYKPQQTEYVTSEVWLSDYKFFTNRKCLWTQ